ncbi:MAG: efflux RND transporter periplasmic adaptor subunit [Candidatus Anammoxibacter sp.]
MTKNTNNLKNDFFGKIKDLYTQETKSVFISLIVVSLVIGLTTGLLIKGCGTGTHMTSHDAAQESGAKILFWTCSMHPQIKQKTSGSCPICGMDLIPMKEDIGGGDKASLTLGKRARQLASVKTTLVVYKNLTKSIYTVGKINYDESKISHVTSWVNGRIDKLYVNFTGTIVQKGEHLVYIYSPELVSTQDEYLIAYRGAKILQKSSIFETAAGSVSLLENTRNRLLLWGITEDQIKKLEETQKAQTHLTIYAPNSGTVIDKNIFEGMYVKTGDRLFTIADLSRVWLYLDIYEYDIQWIKYGQDVKVTTESFPEETFHGTVVFIDPFLDEETRTVRVRVNMDNRKGKLKPGMFANVVIKSGFGAGGIIFDSDIVGKYMCPMHPDIISDKPGDCSECGMDLELVGSGRQNGFGSQIGDIKLSIQDQKGVLAVPHSAVLYTGLRNLVYVEVKEGNYVPREIKLGTKADEYYYVISGLNAGERVVTSGNFLIDSQMQLLGKPSLLFPEGTYLEH